MCMQGDGIYDALMARGDALLSGHSATFTDTSRHADVHAGTAEEHQTPHRVQLQWSRTAV